MIARHRKQAPSIVFADQIDQGTIVRDERHVRIGECSVHCAPGRVTRNGEPVDAAIEPPASPLCAVPRLPYDEALVQRIVDIVSAWPA